MLFIFHYWKETNKIEKQICFQILYMYFSRFGNIFITLPYSLFFLKKMFLLFFVFIQRYVRYYTFLLFYNSIYIFMLLKI